MESSNNEKIKEKVIDLDFNLENDEDELKRKIKEMKIKIREMENNEEELKDDINDMKVNEDKLKQKIKEMENNVEKLKKEINDMKVNEDKLKQKIKEMENNQEKIIKENNEINEEDREYIKYIHEIKNNLIDDIDQLKKLSDKNFNFQNRKFLLTYEGFLNKKKIESFIRKLIFKNKKDDFIFFRVSHENIDKADKHQHSHILIQLENRFSSKNENVFDYDDIHPRIQIITSKEDWKKALFYMGKEDKDNKDLRKYEGLL